MLSPLQCLIVGVALLAPSWAIAQDNAAEGEVNLFAPTLPTPRTGTHVRPKAGSIAPVPFAPETTGATGGDPGQSQLQLEARLVEGQETLKSGLTWRVFGSEPGIDGHLPLVATAAGGTSSVNLPTGTYLVHAAFGQAEATKRITVGPGRQSESLILDAGGLKLDAVIGDDNPAQPDRVSFEVAQDGPNGQRVTVLPKVAPGLILRLKAGTYHVTSRYGTVNSVVRADIEIEAGKLTEAVIHEDGAEATLRLVSEAGGEALANTSWTVLTEGGDTLQESVGAFPRLILASGKYTAVASHNGRTYSLDFEIQSGRDRDVEVKLSDEVAQP